MIGLGLKNNKQVGEFTLIDDDVFSHTEPLKNSWNSLGMCDYQHSVFFMIKFKNVYQTCSVVSGYGVGSKAKFTCNYSTGLLGS